MTHIELPLTAPDTSFMSTGDCAVRRTVHPSGLRVLTERVPGSRTVTVGFWIGAGSRDEDAGHHGSTHFLEHLLFKGTTSRSAFEISETFDAMGAFHNALTAKENTCYLARVRAADLPVAIAVLGDQVSNSLLRAEDFDMERTVILEELAMAADDPDDVCGEQFFAAMFGDSPLARPIGGTVADIENADRSSVVEHYRDRYQPRDLIVTAAGDVDHDDLMRLVVESLVGWDMSDGAPEPRRTQTEAAISGRTPVAVVERDLEQVAVILGVPGVIANDDRRTDLGVLTAILGGGSSSRLFQEIREKRGLAYSVDAFPVTYSDAGALGIGAGCSPKVLPEVLGLMREGLAGMTTITEHELNRARGQILGSATLALESMDARMNRLARAEFLGEYRDLDETERLLSIVTVDSVGALAAELSAGPPVVAAVGAIAADSLV
ncbi:MAG: M16 family metallopeptidase [Rhodoluna sp.]